MIKTIIILFIIPFVAHSISTGANEPIADNELGLTAKDCALQYCLEKDGLALWLTLVTRCVSNPNPYLIEYNNIDNVDTSEQNNQTTFTPVITGLICALISLVGLLLGYIIGSVHAQTHVINETYKQNKKNDHFYEPIYESDSEYD